MSQNDRICKVCGNPKRKFSNGCTNPLCNFNEPEIVNDLDQITVMETIRLNQSQYLRELLTNSSNIWNQNKFLSFISTVTNFLESPFINKETKKSAKIKLKPIYSSYLEYIEKELKRNEKIISIIEKNVNTNDEFIKLIEELIKYSKENHQSEVLSKIIEGLLKISQEVNNLNREFSNCCNVVDVNKSTEIYQKFERINVLFNEEYDTFELIVGETYEPK